MTHLLHTAASLLSPDAPNLALARATGTSKAASRKHRAGTRRPSIAALRMLQAVLREHARACWAAAADLDSEIYMREREPKPSLRGCCSHRNQTA
jgi:hypothetical protein